jgi:hypothetical protein
VPGLRIVAVDTLIAEIGGDMSPLPTAGSFPDDDERFFSFNEWLEQAKCTHVVMGAACFFQNRLNGLSVLHDLAPQLLARSRWITQLLSKAATSWSTAPLPS